MAKYIVKRVLLLIPVILAIAILIFTIMYFVPGDPVALALGSTATQEQKEVARVAMGLDKPFFVQMLNFLKDTFLHFDLGTSYTDKVPVMNSLLARFPRTMAVALGTILISVLFGIPLGINAAVHQGEWRDTASMVLALVGVSMPNFWLAMLLVLLFSVKLGWLPAMGFDGIQYMILPCFAGAMSSMALLARQARSSMLEVIRSDYVMTARAKGVSKRNVIYKHALPNALIPIITVIGGNLAASVAGSLIIENVFSIPGIGLYMIKAINNRDYPAVRGSVIFVSVIFSVVMILVDIVYAFVDPRVKSAYFGNKKRSKSDNG